jgi:alpha-1,3-glucosyltransferase
MDVVALGGLLVRAVVGTYPYSGKGLPPMYGDLEAQRHWMEVTISLPIHEWYTNTTSNDLMYWGLDYPPLTAFWSLAAGLVGKWIVPHAVAWEASRGAEDPSSIAFMRATVLAADIFVFLPVAWLFAQTCTSLRHRVWLFSALVFLPPLVLVDHGHFQYNNVSLGLAILAVTAAARGRHLWAAAAFSCALNYKQMLLYYAPSWFVFLLAESCREGSSNHSASLFRAVRHVATLALVVGLVFAVTWLPFCVFSPRLEDSDFGAASFLQPCGAGMQAVLGRLFPFSRSVFEDKVANLWCAAEPLLKLRERTYADTSGWTRRVAVGAATAATAALMTPALVGCWCMLMRPMSPRIKCPPTSRTLPVSKKSGGASDHRHRSGLVESSTRVSQGDIGIKSCSESDLASPALASTGGSALLARWEVLLVTLHTVALAFFLASYQVHEKTILLPLVPIVMLSHRLPLFAVWFSSVALWSLWPLLVRDGLVVPLCLLGACYLAAFWPTATAVEEGDALFLCQALKSGALCSIFGMDAPAAMITPYLRSAVVLSFAPALGISLCAATFHPPSHLPDFFPFLTAVYACCLLVVAWALGTAMLLSRNVKVSENDKSH